MRGVLAAGLVLALGLYAAVGRADDLSSPPGADCSLTAVPPEISRRTVPLVTLGRPVPLGVAVGQRSNGSVIRDGQVQAVSYRPAAADASNPVVRSQSPDFSGPTLAVPPPAGPGTPATPAEQYNCGVVTHSPGTDHPILDGGRRLLSGIPLFGSEGDGGPGRNRFESDHAFDAFISPMTNPFLFEDPRSLTEVRPIFLYQGTPIRNPPFHGGDIELLALQARLALTDRFSVVMNKLGWVWIEPHNAGGDFQNHAGLTEISLGPKFTFLRCDSTGTLGAVGLNFDFPLGDRRALQDTGSLTLEPYITLGQRFGHTSYGTFQALGTFGYNFSVDNQRSDNFFTSLHLDFDYGDLHKIYPLIELHWFHYTSNGKARDLNFEGRDLFNFGSRRISGHDEVSLAAGARFKINECLQMGLAAEIPLTTRRDLMDYRLMVDFIIRY